MTTEQLRKQMKQMQKDLDQAKKKGDGFRISVIELSLDGVRRKYRKEVFNKLK